LDYYSEFSQIQSLKQEIRDFKSMMMSQKGLTLEAGMAQGVTIQMMKEVNAKGLLDLK